MPLESLQHRVLVLQGKRKVVAKDIEDSDSVSWAPREPTLRLTTAEDLQRPQMEEGDNGAAPPMMTTSLNTSSKDMVGHPPP
jgi:hypothetical protein